MNKLIFKTPLLLIWFCCLNLNAISFEKDGIKYEVYYGDAVVMGLVDPYYSGRIEIPFWAKNDKTGKEYRVREINEEAFLGCHMSEIYINYIESIGDYAFKYCRYLEKVSIGKLCSKIGEGIFHGAQELKVNIDIENIYYDSRDGCNAIIETSTNRLIAGSNKTTIPEGVECLATGSFSALLLESISIPKSVKEIEEWAIKDLYGYLKEIYVTATEPPTVYQNSFVGWYKGQPYPNFDVTLYVPKGCIEKYRNHNIWGQFNIIEEYDSTTSIHKTEINKSDDDRYFDISGRMHETPLRGLNIVKKKDGTTKKIIIKQ